MQLMSNLMFLYANTYTDYVYDMFKQRREHNKDFSNREGKGDAGRRCLPEPLLCASAIVTIRASFSHAASRSLIGPPPPARQHGSPHPCHQQVAGCLQHHWNGCNPVATNCCRWLPVLG